MRSAADRWRPVITWSRKEFLTEAVWERTGAVVNGVPQLKTSNALNHRVDLGPIMKPVMPLPSYPRGFLVLHEENLTIGRALGTSSKFIYALHPKTMAYITRRWRNRGDVEITDLEIGDKQTWKSALRFSCARRLPLTSLRGWFRRRWLTRRAVRVRWWLLHSTRRG